MLTCYYLLKTYFVICFKTFRTFMLITFIYPCKCIIMLLSKNSESSYYDQGFLEINIILYNYLTSLYKSIKRPLMLVMLMVLKLQVFLLLNISKM